MKLKSLRYRQVHLDFHTSPDIERIGQAFNKKEWQETLRRGRVDSITCFSKCHHGLSYHPTKVGALHPHLKFDLLRAQIDACREIDVRVPLYLSAGLDNHITQAHADWREITFAGAYSPGALAPGFHKLCFSTPYLDYLCRQIEEAVTLFPEGDGVFLDIINQGPCCCRWCMEAMAKSGLDAEKEEDRLTNARLALERYYKATTAACKVKDADMPVYHNSGHLPRGRRDLLAYTSHLELESLPTGGWGYDHFPEASTYASHLGQDFLGMTGKFHTWWGEFGGFKHPNALRYECAAMNALGAKCSVGDQLHPEGRLDLSTYDLIGAAYREVQEREAWCRDTIPVCDIAILSVEAEDPKHPKGNYPDAGAVRLLSEGHHLFTLIDREVDFSDYRLLILPDEIGIDDALRAKIDAYLRQGGKLLLTGRSGLTHDKNEMAFDIGATYSGVSPFSPDYIVPIPAFQPSFVHSPLVIYHTSHLIKATTGTSLGEVFHPYFNRTFRHFCSHQHTPNRAEPSGYDCGVRHGNIVYLAQPIFWLYRKHGAVAYKEYALRIINDLLGDDRQLTTNLSSPARITLRRQPSEKRQIVHLLHASKIARGEPGMEVIEELDPIHDITVSVRTTAPIARVTLEPQGDEISHVVRDGAVEFHVKTFTGHQMAVLHER